MPELDVTAFLSNLLPTVSPESSNHIAAIH
jgi:hypothetical protein